MRMRIYYLLITLFFIGFNVLKPIDPLGTSDALGFNELATQVITGHGYTHLNNTPAIDRPPTYIYFLAAIYKIHGLNAFFWLKIYQLILLLLTYWALLQISKKTKTNPQLLSILYLIYFPNYLYASQVLSEVMIMFLLSFGIYYFLEKKWIPLGLVYGLLVLTKGIFILLPLVLFSPKHWKQLAVSIFISLTLILPWTIRNYLCFKQPIYSSIGIGNVLWPGNNPKTNGYWAGGKDTEWAAIAYNYDEITADKLLTQKALANIKAHPYLTAQLWLKKAWRFWSTPVGYQTLKDQNQTIPALLWLSIHWMILLAALYSAWQTKKSELTRLILFIIGYYYSIHIILYAIPRYHYPLMGLVFILAAEVMLKRKNTG